MAAARKNASACRAASGLACRSRTMASSRWLTTLRRQTSAARIKRAKFSASGSSKNIATSAKYRESLRQPVLVIEQFAMLDVWTLDGLRRPFGDGHQFRQTCLAFALLDLCVPLPEGFNDHLGQALPGFPGNRLGQTMGFRIFDVETHDRSPILENPLQFYHSRKIGSSRFSRSCPPQVSERTSGNCALVSRQGFTDSRREQPTAPPMRQRGPAERFYSPICGSRSRLSRA